MSIDRPYGDLAWPSLHPMLHRRRATAMARHPRRVLMLAAAGLLVALGIASPASAAPPHQPTGGTSWDIPVPAHQAADGKAVPAVTVHCSATFTPEPQYSKSGGTK